MAGDHRAGQRHGYGVVGAERRREPKLIERGLEPLRRRTLGGKRRNPHFLDGESTEAALQRRDPQRILRPIESQGPVHQSSFQ